MQLVKVRPKYFRAFGDSDWIDLNASLVVLFGPNGFGKTSLTEAVEWLLYGKTKRRERGEALSQRDYHLSFRNAHAPEGEMTSVEGVFKRPDDSEVTLKRELLVGPRGAESTRTFVDGAEGTFGDSGISEDEIYCPVIAQDGLQDFIHSRPKERRDKISAALGLVHLVRFKTAADRARSRFQADAPPAVAQAQAATRVITAKMRRSDKLRNVAEKLESGSFDLRTEGRTVVDAAVQVLGSLPGNSEALVAALKERRNEASLRVFDDAPLRVPADMDYRRRLVEATKNAAKAEATALGNGLAEFLKAATAKYSQALLSFWKTGLTLQEGKASSSCPMCEQDTLTQAKRDELEGRIKQSAKSTAARQDLAQATSRAVAYVRQARQRSEALFPPFMKPDEKAALTRLAGSTPALADFIKEHDSSSGVAAKLSRDLSTLEASLSQIESLAASSDTVSQAELIVTGFLAETSSLITLAEAASVAYEKAYLTFQPVIQDKISSSTAVAELDVLLAPLEGWEDLRIVALYQRLLSETLEIVRQIESHVQTKQTERFGARGQEIHTWYEMMNRGAQVRYSKMEPGTDSITLWADTFGVQINAAACLSQCQLNCLGLSVHLMRTLTQGSPFTFVLLDDPVQSMDDDHCQALIVDVVKALLDRGTQVIIFSHVQGLVDSIWETYYDRQPLRLRIEDFAKSGPRIGIAETLQKTIQKAGQMAAGNEDNRRLAVKVVRRAVELLIRDTCRHTYSPPLPHDANVANMLPFFQSCPGTTPQQSQGLRETARFANPGPHTQVGWPVPTTVQIMPHIDRLRETARQLGLLT